MTTPAAPQTGYSKLTPHWTAWEHPGTTSSFQVHTSIAADGSDGFVVVWESYFQDGDSGGIFGQRLDSTGNRLGQEFQVNTYETSYQYRPAVAAGASGEFVVAWIGGGMQDLNSRGIFAQRFDSDGMPAGGEFQVNSYTTGNQAHPEIATTPGGNFKVVWHGPKSGKFEIAARKYDSEGQALGEEFRVAGSVPADQTDPAIAGEASGGLVVTWS